MNEAFKNDPILRAVVVTFAGVIVFGFLFGYNFSGPGEMGGGVGYPGSFLGQLISFLMHILLLALVVTLIGGLFMGFKKFYSSQEGTLKNSKPVTYIAQDPVLKTAAYVFGGIIALYFLCSLLRILFWGFLNPYFLLMALIGFLIKLLGIGLVIALSIGIYQYVQSTTSNNQGNRQDQTMLLPEYSASSQNDSSEGSDASEKPDDRNRINQSSQ